MLPGGTLTVTGPSRVGTFTLAPRAASGKLTGTVTVRSLPRRPKTGCRVGADHDVEVAGRAAAPTGAASGLDPDALAVLDSGGDANLDLPGPVFDPGAKAGGTGVLDPDSRPAAGLAGLAEGEQPLVVVDHAPPPADRADLGDGARRRARAAAGVALRLRGEVDAWW